jgi:hypothetical protein
VEPGSHLRPPGNVDGLSSQGEELVSEEAYRNFVLCLQPWENAQNQHCAVEPAAASQIPSHQDAGAFTMIYFARFHPVYPFLRKGAFLFGGETGWILLLAVMTVGAKYAHDSPTNRQHRDTLFGLLRAVLSHHLHPSPQAVGDSLWAPEPSGDEGTSRLDLPIIQAAVLSQLCMLHSGNGALLRRASLERLYLVDACNNMGLLSAADTTISVDICDKPTAEQWLESQSRIRTGMMIWVYAQLPQAALEGQLTRNTDAGLHI